MKRKTRLIVNVVTGIVLLAVIGVMKVTRDEAHKLVTAPQATQNRSEETPATHNMPYEDVTVTTADGLKLAGWLVPSQNGATVILQHGYKSRRSELLNEAEMLYRHGYGFLFTTVRAHDGSDGELITFGINEVNDLDAWYQYLISRPEVEAEKIGMLGNSYGGMLAIQYTAYNENIKAMVANCAFSSLNDTVETSVEYFTDLPAFPFAPLIVFWAERETGFRTEDIDATKWIAQINPRPVFLMQGGADVVISPDSGQKLYDAAGEPKELWFDPELGHVEFDKERAAEYEQRVVEFFDKYLLGK